MSGLQASYIADIGLNLIGHFRHANLNVMAHIVLLLLVTGEYTDFTNIGPMETVQNRVSEGSCPSSDEEDFVFENGHITILSYDLFIP